MPGAPFGAWIGKSIGRRYGLDGGRQFGQRIMGKQQGKTKAEFLAEYCNRMGILSGHWASMEEVADVVVFLGLTAPNTSQAPAYRSTVGLA